MGDEEVGTPVFMESMLKYHSDSFDVLTWKRDGERDSVWWVV